MVWNFVIRIVEMTEVSGEHGIFIATAIKVCPRISNMVSSARVCVYTVTIGVAGNSPLT